MAGLLSFVLALPAQQGQGVPWWVWLLLLIVVIALLIWWLRRSEAKSAAGKVQAPEPAQAVQAPPLEEAAAAPVAGAIAEEGGRAVEVPAAGEVPAAQASAAAARPARPARGLRGPAAWRTRMWQPESPPRYLAWKHRRLPAVQPPSEAAPAARAVEGLEPGDDLTRIEGIGPKIAGLLQGAGIRTFRELASADAGRLREILAEANLRNLADPGTWPEQAALAAAGRWDEFEALTARLKGGRRV